MKPLEVCPKVGHIVTLQQ